VGWGATLALAAVVAALALGAGLGAYRAAQSPAFYAAIIALLWDKLKPAIVEAVMRDFTPERAKEVSDAVRQAKDPDWRGKHGHAGENH